VFFFHYKLLPEDCCLMTATTSRSINFDKTD